jgi:hypothetical protein
MKSLEEFKGFCKTNLQELLTDLDTQRKKIKQQIILAIGIGVAMILSGIFIHPAAVIVFGFGLGLFIWLKIYNPYQTFHKSFKEKLIWSIVKFIDDKLSYRHDYCVHENTFSYSNIFNESYTHYNGDDYVSGDIGKTSLEFSELHVSRVEGSGKNRRTVQVFNGLFFIGDFHKNFNGETYVLTDTAESWFGSIGSKLQSMNMSRPSLVKLEDSEFEKCFVVYSSDQVEARYILSPSLMERILKLKSKLKCNVQMSFKSSKVFMSIPMSKNFLAPSLFNSLLESKQLDEYFSDLKLMIEIVEDLSLNTRIWTKA